MIRITDQETRLLAEQIFGESCGELYKPDGFSEWEGYERLKQDIYETVWDSEQLFWDIYEMAQKGMFSEAAPDAFSNVGTADTPDIARKQVKISKQMAYLGLPQVPARAAAGFLANNMVSSNPKLYRYVGKGFFGALQDRAEGKEPTNWVNEIRYVMQGKPMVWVIDPETLSPIPRLGAVTNRPIEEGVPQLPPAWNDYASRKAHGFQDPKTGEAYHGVYIGYADHIRQLETTVGKRIQLTKGGERTIKADPEAQANGTLTPIHGVKRDEKGRPVIGPDGHPEKGDVIGYVDRRTNQTVKTKGWGMGRGEVGVDLSPPIPGDPSSYLGMAADKEAGTPAIPPGARGYKPQGFASSNALQRQWGQYKWYMMHNPEMFDQRLLRVLMAKQRKDTSRAIKAQQRGRSYARQFTPEKKGRIPVQQQNLQTNVPRMEPYPPDPKKPDNYGRARDFQKVAVADKKNSEKTRNLLTGVLHPDGHYRRSWYRDPHMPARQLLGRATKRDLTDDERERQYTDLMGYEDEKGEWVHGLVGKLKERLAGILDQMGEIEKRMEDSPTQHFMDAQWKDLNAQKNEIKKRIAAATKEAKRLEVGFTSVPTPAQTGTFGNKRIAYTPEEEEEIRKKGTLNGVPVGAQNRDRFVKRGKLVKDDKGKNVPLPTMGAVRRMVLPNNYILTPDVGDPIIVSEKILQMASQAGPKTESANPAVKARAREDLIQAASTGSRSDKVFAKYADKYGLQIQKNGSFSCADPQRVGAEAVNKPWCWARTDEQGDLFFRYYKDTKTHNIPLYLPGVIDDRKPGNPTAAGGWDAAPSGSPELRPYRDAERTNRALNGYKDPVTKEFVEGWADEMHLAAQEGVKYGLAELLKDKFKKQTDQFGRTGEAHSTYVKLQDASKDIVQNAFMYFQYNLANAKALDFRNNPVAHLDVQYIKYRFPQLYAACMQFNRWLDQPSKVDPNIPNRWFIFKSLKSHMTIFDLTFVQIGQVLDRLKKYTETEKEEAGVKYKEYDPLFRTKINQSYIKNGLKDFTADDMGVRHQYNATGGRTTYKYLDVSYETFKELFDEARRNYWVFAAKDMVIKTWQRMKGGNLASLYKDDSIDAAKASLGTQRRKGIGGASNDIDSGDVDMDDAPDTGDDLEGDELPNGPTRNALSGDNAPQSSRGHQKFRHLSHAQFLQNFLKITNEKYAQVQQDHNKLKSQNDGSMENAIDQLALIPEALRLSWEIEIGQQISDEVEKSGMNKNMDTDQFTEWFRGELNNRLREKAASYNKHQTKEKAAPAKAGTDFTPEEYLQDAQKKGVALNDHHLTGWADTLLHLKHEMLDEAATDLARFLSKMPDSKTKEMAERTITYDFIKKLIKLRNDSGGFGPKTIDRFTKMAHVLVHEYRILYQLGSLIPQVLGRSMAAPPEEPAVTAQTQDSQAKAGSLGSRLRRRTG